MFLKKTTKLLSVLLAVVMMLSCFTMAAHAAKAVYQTGANLNTLGAYSPDGAATRFSTEERMSILFDWLDTVLYGVNFAGIHNTKVVNIDITINSVDEICASLDSVKSALGNWLVGLAGGIGLLGDLTDLSLDKWTSGTRRSGAQLTIVKLLLDVLKDNANFVDSILSKGKINLGSIVGGMVDLSKINKILGNLPKFILSKLYPLMSRKDDTKTVADNYFNGVGAPSTVLNTFVNALFTKPQSTTTYKENASGTCISGHTLPTASQNLRYYYVKTGSGDGAYFTCYVWDSQNQKYVAEDAKFYREEEGTGTGIYTYKTPAGDGLKYYKTGSYWLPSYKTANESFNVNSDSVASIFYKFIPYVFGDLAPIALNGFVKQALATWMGATETKIYEGKAGTAEASAILATLPAAAQTMFSAAVPYYQFSYSAYDAENNGDTQYYRYVDKDTNTEEWFEIDMTTGNYFLGLFNMDYTVASNFMDEFVPGKTGAKSTLLQSLNDFLCKAAQTILKSDVYASLGLQTGDNTYLVSNIRKAAQKLLPESPDAVLGTDYLHHYDGYYQTMVSTTASNDEVFSALAAIIAKALMPQLILPSAEKLAGQKVGAVLACVVRELVTQMVPTYNYDALIFSNYNTRTLVSGKDNSYWLDVILTMGVDVGMSYLSNLTDLGRDTTNGFKFAASKTYDLTTFESNPQAWEATVDWIIDWALTSGVEWGWNMEKLINISSFTGNNAVDLAKVGDPWVKLDKILTDLLPLKEIINCTAASGKTWLETVLRDKLILGIADLHFDYIFGKGTDYTASGNAGLLSIPSSSVLRKSGSNNGALVQLWVVVRNLLNVVLNKVLGTNLLATGTFTTIDTLNSQANIRTLIKTLLTNLPTAYTNGLLVVVLPIVEMFVGWKTGSQEFKDPEVKWSGYVHTTDGATLSITNMSAGMLLKNYNASGGSNYEKAYNVIIDQISGSGLTFTVAEGSTTIAPYGRLKYTVKTSNTSESAVQVIIKYHVTGKSGATLGGDRYLSTYVVISPNKSDIQKDNGTNDYNKNGGTWGTTKYIVQDAEWTQYAICTSRDNLENIVTSQIWAKTINKSEEYDYKITSYGFTSGSNGYIKAGLAASNVNNTVVSKGSEYQMNPAALTYAADKKDSNDNYYYVSGSKYSIGTVTWNAVSTSDSGVSNGPGSSPLNLGYLYFADAGELEKLFNDEMGKNRMASEYNTASKYTAYTNAMKAAAVLLNAPKMDSTFSTVFAQSNIDAKYNALKTAVENLDEDMKEAEDNSAILENGLAAGETAALIGADDQINFQDFNLYGYWLYEKNRTEGRNILKEYQQPTAPEQYIKDCWLPYTDSEKHEDLSTVINAEANTTKKNAIIGSLEDPDAKDVAAYNQAAAEWQMPGYSALYVADIADKLDYYNDYLIPRAYSKNSAGRAQLAQEIAYAQAQNYNAADYTARSWARYQTALTEAQAIGNSDMQSYVFLAKYNLLKAQRDLRLVAYDYETQVGYEGLQALVDLAEGMFANAAYFTAVDGTLDTEWTDLIEALGYTATFGTGSDEWSMDLYAKSAKQLMSEELDTRSARNEERVEKVTETLQAAIDALKCTIEVIKNDATTNVDQDIKYITNLTPGTILVENDVRTHVAVSNNAATLTITGVGAGNAFFGTGTKVAATLSGIPIANYYIVIYGDINGDDVIDGFDAVKADRKLSGGLTTLTAPQIKAADATKDGVFEIADVSAIISAAAGNTDINQA